MRVPTWELLAHWSRFCGVFVCGMIVGAALFMAVYQRNFNDLTEWNHTLRIELQDLRSANIDLEKNMNKQAVISSVQVFIERNAGQESFDTITEEKVRSKVRQDLRELWVGEKISSLDTGSKTLKSLYKRLLSDINGKDYLVQIDSMFAIYGQLRVWIVAEEYTQLNPH